MINNQVSIIVPIYGVEKYIVDCANSLFEQTYPYIEFIFVNDATKDKSIEYLTQISKGVNKKITIINHDENCGLAAARNTGVKNSSGEFIIHVDGDDRLESNAVELLIQKACNLNADIVVSNMMILTKNKMCVEEIAYSLDIKEYLELALKRKANFNLAGKLIKRSLYTNLSFEEGVNYGEDYLMFPKLLSKASVLAAVPKGLYIYNKLNDNSYTNNINIESIKQLCKAQLSLIEYFGDNETMRKSSAQVIAHMVKQSGSNFNTLKYLNDFQRNLSLNIKELSLIDKIILKLLEKQQYYLLSLIIRFGSIFIM